ncbi:hypothetical protein [Labedella endophytica]|uniref:hypothetical protein n=1 Tax=Labedella endophytica TaxID=1523160 RepID=UPI001FB6D29B|nr:hypothetical protein [Labedella endophytica]
MSSISPDDIRWNDEARAKILEDSDRVLREAVLDVAATHSAGSWEDAFAELNARLKDQFIDFEPGPDLRQYAEAIVGVDIEGVEGGSSDSDSGSDTDSDSDSAASSDAGASSDSGASSGGAATPATRAESTPAETADATGGGAYADAPADQIAAESGAAEPATPETDGSGDASPDAEASSTSDASGDPASGGASDGTEAPNETIDDPSDPTVTDEPGA